VQMFPKGYYCYTGSARGSGSTNLKHRIGRHLKKEKRMFWHIDYVLKNQNINKITKNILEMYETVREKYSMESARKKLEKIIRN